MPTETTAVAIPHRALRQVTDLMEQEAETYHYWQSRTTAQRMAAIDEIIRDGYAAKGIDIDAQRSDRSIVRIQRPQR